MKVLLFAGIYPNKGSGNFVRMIHLYKYLLLSQYIERIDFYTNDTPKATTLSKALMTNYVTFTLDTKYDVVIVDSPEDELNFLSKIQYSKSIVMDYFDYKAPFDIFINLFNHNRDDIVNCKGKVLEGLQFAIISEQFLALKKQKILSNTHKVNILITFGGEDPASNTFKTLSLLEAVSNVNVTVIVGTLNRDSKKIKALYTHKYSIIPATHDMASLMLSQDILICGGGTTLLEALFVGNPIITYAQNRREEDFIASIGECVPLYSLEDIEKLIQQCRNEQYRDEIYKAYHHAVDGQGKSRIEALIISQDHR